MQNDYASKVKRHLILAEGFRDYVYKDSLGKLTGGVGHLLSLSEQELYPLDTNIPEDILYRWYEKDTEKAMDATDRQIKFLDKAKQVEELKVALVSVNFQLGSGWTRKFPTAWSHMKNGKWGRDIQEIKYRKEGSAELSSWNKQTPRRVKDFVSALEAQLHG